MNKDLPPDQPIGEWLGDFVPEADRSQPPESIPNTQARSDSATPDSEDKNSSAASDTANTNRVVPAGNHTYSQTTPQPFSEAELSHVDVGRIVFSFYCIAPDSESAKARVKAVYQRLLQLVEQSSDFPQPERGNFDIPYVHWLDWSLHAPQTHLSWCGVCELILEAEHLQDGQGCLWQLEQYKRFAWWLDRLLKQAISETAGEFPSVRLDDKPFLWTLALDLTPRVVWTDQALQQYRRSLTDLLRVRSEDSHIYTDRAMQELLRSNLAYTTEELQLLHYNTGFIYVAHERFRRRGGFGYVQQALVNSNALIRAVRACLLLFRKELNDRLHKWLRERLRGRRLRRVLQETFSYASLASQLLQQFDEQAFCATRQIGHQQTVFRALLQRYHVPELVAGLQQQVTELHYRIADLQNQFQASQLRLINLLVVIPALYYLWRFVHEFWPVLQPLFDAWLGL